MTIDWRRKKNIQCCKLKATRVFQIAARCVRGRLRSFLINTALVQVKIGEQRKENAEQVAQCLGWFLLALETLIV